MSSEIIINVQRGASHATVLQNVPVRTKEISPIVIAGAGGSIPYNSLELYSRVGTPAIKQGDLLTDIVSGQQYRVSGTPIVYDMSYLKVMIERITGVTP